MAMAAAPEPIELHRRLSWLFLLASLPTYLVTRYVLVAPFGRHAPDDEKQKKGGRSSRRSRHRWWFGPLINAPLSWFIFECPNLLWIWYCVAHWCDENVFFLVSRDAPPRALIAYEGGGDLQISANAALLFLFALHYVNRAIIYPLRMNKNSHKVPLLVTLSASAVTICNGYLQSFYLVRVHKFDPLSFSASWSNLQRWLGIGIFFAGMGINIHSDGVLRNLRRYGPSGKPRSRAKGKHTTEVAYYIPHSPFFQRVSCPNFGGEMLEWLGFAVASQFSLPPVAFFVYTASNLIPRAVAHHEWYLRKFDDYPKERKWAVVPFVV